MSHRMIAAAFASVRRSRPTPGAAPSTGAVRRSGNRFKPGTFSRPHFHPNDRFITVIKGTWYVGTGNIWDKDATIPVKAGGAVTHFGKEVHYDGAKDEEVIVLITGEGPGTNTPVEIAK